MPRTVVTLFAVALAVTLTRPAFAACPGTSGCKLSKCPAGAIIIAPGKSIQKAIKAAPCTRTTICVQPGVYTGKINFLGKPITLISIGGPAVTTLNGGGSGPVVTFSTFEGADSVLDGFTVTNGQAPNGGGILVRDASPWIKNCIVHGNRATGGSFPRGGGLWAAGASAKPKITCTQFVANSADFGGGGLASTGFADPYLRNDHFLDNSAPFGGGIAVHHQGRLDVATTYFQNNQALGDGGGIHSGTNYGNVLVRQSWFKGNRAGSFGGGMWVPAGLAQVINNTFAGNLAATGGGIATGHGGMLSAASNLFVNNTNGALVNIHPTSSNSSLVNHYNGFFGNTPSGTDFVDTYGDIGFLLSDPQLAASPNDCCPVSSSPAIDAGIPDPLFNDGPGTRNDMGACGGPTL